MSDESSEHRAKRGAERDDGQSTRHAPPFYCPYCGEDDIAPHGETSDEWRCASCLRAFVLRLSRTGVAS